MNPVVTQITSAPSIEPPVLPSRDLLRQAVGQSQGVQGSGGVVVRELAQFGEDLRALEREGRGRTVTSAGVYLKFDQSVPPEKQKQISRELTEAGAIVHAGGNYGSASEQLAAERARSGATGSVTLATAQVEVSQGADGTLRYKYSGAFPTVPGIGSYVRPTVTIQNDGSDTGRRNAASQVGSLLKSDERGGTLAMIAVLSGPSIYGVDAATGDFSVLARAGAEKQPAPRSSAAGEIPGSGVTTISFEKKDGSPGTILMSDQDLANLRGKELHVDGRIKTISRTAGYDQLLDTERMAESEGRVPSLTRETRSGTGPALHEMTTSIPVQGFNPQASPNGYQRVNLEAERLPADLQGLAGLTISHVAMRPTGVTARAQERGGGHYPVLTDGAIEEAAELVASADGKRFLQQYANALSAAERGWGVKPNTLARGVVLSSEMRGANEYIDMDEPIYVGVAIEDLKPAADGSRPFSNPRYAQVSVDHELIHSVDARLGLSSGKPEQRFGEMEQRIDKLTKALEVAKGPEVQRATDALQRERDRQERYFTQLDESSSFGLGPGGHSSENIQEHTASHLNTHGKKDWSQWIRSKDAEFRETYRGFTEDYLENLRSLPKPVRDAIPGVAQREALLAAHLRELNQLDAVR